MTKLTLRTRALSALVIVGSFAAACAGEDDTATGGDGDGDMNGTGTGGNISVGVGGTPGAGGTGTIPSKCSDNPKGGTIQLIDDMEHDLSASIAMVDGRTGSWFTASDGTPGSTQTPTAMAAYPTAAVGFGATFGFKSVGAGFEDWGANFGVSLNDTAGVGCGYNASDFTGIEFDIFGGLGTAQSVKVGVPIPAIIPSTRPGGTCSGEGCDDAHHTFVEVEPGWNHFMIEWSELEQEDWGHPNIYPFDPANIVQVTFGIKGGKSTPGAYDLVVDNLRFTGGSNGGAGEGGGN